VNALLDKVMKSIAAAGIGAGSETAPGRAAEE